VIVVSDTSALSNLAIINHLWLLEAIYQTVIIPDVVASELVILLILCSRQSMEPFC
jgi:uncharacterized protein